MKKRNLPSKICLTCEKPFSLRKNWEKNWEEVKFAASAVEEIKMGKAANLIFPHQLFADSPLLENGHVICLIEEYLFFKQYKFHKQKIALHRASMKSYQADLQNKGLEVFIFPLKMNFPTFAISIQK